MNHDANPNLKLPPTHLPGMTPGPDDLGKGPPATFIQFTLGIIVSFVLGYVFGRLAPRDWIPTIQMPVIFDPAQESVLGGIVVTIDPQPATSVTKLEADGSVVKTESYTVKFDLTNSNLASQGKNLYVGDGWPAAEGWPVDLGPSVNTYFGIITYTWNLGSGNRKFTIEKSGTMLTYEFSGPSDGTTDPSSIATSIRAFNAELQTANLVIRYKGYADAIPLKIAAPGP